VSNFRALVLHEEGGKVVPRLETVDEARLPPRGPAPLRPSTYNPAQALPRSS